MGGVSNPGFDYDPNGNLVCEHAGANCSGTGIVRQASYTSFNMASTIVQGGNSYCLTYDSEHDRITQVQTSASCASPGSGAQTTTYLNDPASGAMAEAVASGGITTWHDYLMADGKIIAVRNAAPNIAPPVWGSVTWGSFAWTQAAPGTALDYFSLDNLGSVAVITDQGGAIAEIDSYDSWGNRICLTIVSREGREAAVTQVQPRYTRLGKYQRRQ